MDRVTRNAPTVLLGAALAACGALLLYLTREFTFLQDTWEFLMNRRDFTAEAIFKPHNEHIVVIPVLLEQALLRLFGMTSARPEYVLLVASLVAVGWLMFVYVRRRLGPWPALFATVLLLFLGAAWEVLLWPFEISFVGSVLFGIAMLLALDRDDRDWDIAACLFLTLSFGFSELGIPFAVAAAVNVFQRRGERGLRRAYMVLVPVLLYAAWYVGWGSEAESHLSLHNVLASPRFVFEAVASAVGSVFGLADGPLGKGGGLLCSSVLLVAIIVALVRRHRSKPGIPPAFWPIAAAAATNWLLTALNAVPGREPTSSRYQYMGAVLVILLLSNLLKGVRFSRRALAVAAVVTVVAVVSNLAVLKDGKEVFMRTAFFTRADMAALEISRHTVEPGFWLSPTIAGTPSIGDIQAEKYLAAVREFGSPAESPQWLAAAPEVYRRQADIVLAAALPVSAPILPGGAGVKALRCSPLRPGRGGELEVRLAAGVTWVKLAPGPRAELSLRRFARAHFPVKLGRLPGGSVAAVHIPADEAPQPWWLRVAGGSEARACR
jgi:hypothetical protein